MRKITVREFRNNFCTIYKTRESVIVTNRGKVVGIYNPSNTLKILCDNEKFSGEKCVNEATYFVRASKEDYDAQGNLCNDCYKKLKRQEVMDSSLKLEERML
jgi:hypothetical protein